MNMPTRRATDKLPTQLVQIFRHEGRWCARLYDMIVYADTREDALSLLCAALS